MNAVVWVHFMCVQGGRYIFGGWRLAEVYFGWVGLDGHFLCVGGIGWWRVGVSGAGHSF